MTADLEPAAATWRWLLARAAGTVDEGVLAPATSPAAEELVELYSPIACRPDVVVAQLGQSLDGRIATHTGHSHYINGAEDLIRLHRLRALVDAVVVGAGTVEADDPRLTVRRVDGPHPIRVVLDPRRRLPSSRHVFVDGVAPTLWLCGADGGAAADTGPHVDVVPMSTDATGAFDPVDVLATLRERGVRRVLVEGGGVTVSRFIEAGVVERLHVSVAPLLIGSGRPALTLPAIDHLDEALRPEVRHFRLGRDLLFDLDLSPRDSG